MKSSTLAARPSRCAAIAISMPTVMTPVPPTPVTSRSQGASPSVSGMAGAGSASTRRRKSLPAPVASPSAPRRRRGVAPTRPTKLGQKPWAQDSSRLQAEASMRRFLPIGVSIGCTATQLDCALQSPQPSQTPGWMCSRRGGVASSPLRRRRRFSAAQVCS